MVTRVNPHRVNGDYEEDEFEEDYEPSFNKASDESDKSLLFIGGLVGLSAILGVLESVPSAEKESLLEDLGSSTSTESPLSLDSINEFLQEYQSQELEIAESLVPEDLSHLNQMMEEARQYGRISDPKTAENITFNNESRIAEQIGQFGYHEATTQGNLNVAANEGVLFPWDDSGDDNVCDDCLDLAANGPYLANNYPEVPHYECRCNEPFPDPIIALPGEVEDESKYSFQEPLPMNLSFREFDLMKCSNLMKCAIS